MLMNKKGQALVEFVILLPIIMMIIFVIIDFSNVFYQKNHLESITNDITSVVKENGNYSNIEEKQKIEVNTNKNGNTLEIEVKKEIKLITPFSNIFFEDPFTIKTERFVIYE